MPGKARTPKGATYWSGWTLPIGSVKRHHQIPRGCEDDLRLVAITDTYRIYLDPPDPPLP